jgi:hypothetical protein
LDLGRSHRIVSSKQFRALVLRDGGHCLHPGCVSAVGLEAHHVRHWLYGGRTDLDNLALLCRRHHHGHHDGEFRIVALGGGRFRFVRPDGAELPDHVHLTEHIGTRTPVESEHPDVAADAATSRWDGSRLDHDHALAALAQHLHTTESRRAADARSIEPRTATTRGGLERIVRR